MRKKNRRAVRAATASIPFILASAAHAQSTPPADAADQQEITVTGTRISRPSGFTTPTPVTVLGADRLEQRGSRTSVTRSTSCLHSAH
jgi:hypothetical protein